MEQLRSHAWVIGGAVGILALVLFLLVPPVTRCWQCRFDMEMAEDVEKVAGDYLMNLSQTNPSFASSLGKFSGWNGKGYSRPRYSWMIIPRLEMKRKALFSKCKVEARLYVIRGSKVGMHRVDFWPKGNLTIPPWETVHPQDLVLDLWITHAKFQHIK